MELLVTIAVLGLVVLIIVPQANKIMNNASNSAYQETVKNIEDAAYLYRIRNSHLFPSEVGEESIVTVKTLQEKGLLSYNIQDQRNKIKIDDGDVFVKLLGNGEYSYIYKNSNYSKDNLVLWYDGLYKGNDLNKWLDRSNSKNDGILANFAHNSISGFMEDYIRFSGTSETITAPNPLSYQTTSNQEYTIFIVLELEAYTTNTPRITGINSGIHPLTTSNKALHYINSGANDYYAYSKSVIPLNKKMQMAFRFYKNAAANQMKVEFLIDGVDESANNFAANQAKIPAGMSSSLVISRMNNMKLYSIRIYNKVLSDDEIKRNYEVDRDRFNF